MTKKISELPGGRFYCEYINPKDKMLSGLGQFGKTPFEAEINLLALLNAVNKERFKSRVIIFGGAVS